MKSGNYEAPDSAVISSMLLISLPHVVNMHFVLRNLRSIFLNDGERQSPTLTQNKTKYIYTYIYIYLKL